jgi:hypothetical protein
MRPCFVHWGRLAIRVARPRPVRTSVFRIFHAVRRVVQRPFAARNRSRVPSSTSIRASASYRPLRATTVDSLDRERARLTSIANKGHARRGLLALASTAVAPKKVRPVRAAWTVRLFPRPCFPPTPVIRSPTRTVRGFHDAHRVRSVRSSPMARTADRSFGRCARPWPVFPVKRRLRQTSWRALRPSSMPRAGAARKTFRSVLLCATPRGHSRTESPAKSILSARAPGAAEEHAPRAHQSATHAMRRIRASAAKLATARVCQRERATRTAGPIRNARSP